MNLKLVFPDGQPVNYKVPVLRMQWYSLEELLEKIFLQKGQEKSFRDMMELINRITGYIFLKSKKMKYTVKFLRTITMKNRMFHPLLLRKGTLTKISKIFIPPEKRGLCFFTE